MKAMLADIVGEHGVFENEPMSRHTTFRTGGCAEYLVQPANAEQVIEIINRCRDAGCNFYIIGNGSNILVRDEGLRGVVVKIGKNMSDINITHMQTVSDDVMIHAQAGAMLSRIGRYAADNGLTGFEFATGIPGSLGGAVAMNAGAYGGEMADVIEEVCCIDGSGDIITYSGAQMDFSYRNSRILKTGMIVVSALIRLRRGEKDYIEKKITELAVKRREKQPLEYPSAGSTFKRPEGYFAGKLIQDAGLGGFSIGGAAVSEKHCGFIINKNNASSRDIIELIEHVRNVVYEKFNVLLEPEVRIL